MPDTVLHHPDEHIPEPIYSGRKQIAARLRISLRTLDRALAMAKDTGKGLVLRRIGGEGGTVCAMESHLVRYLDTGCTGVVLDAEIEA